MSAIIWFWNLENFYSVMKERKKLDNTHQYKMTRDPCKKRRQKNYQDREFVYFQNRKTERLPFARPIPIRVLSFSVSVGNKK